MTFLEKMRNRSNFEKKVIAFNIALATTLFIFAIWVISKFYSIDWGIDDSMKTVSSPVDFIVSGAKSFFGGMTGK